MTPRGTARIVPPMNIQIAALCDAATDYGGKLNLLGARAVAAPQSVVRSSHPSRYVPTFPVELD